MISAFIGPSFNTVTLLFAFGQFILTPFLIGYIWSVYHGIGIFKKAVRKQKYEEEIDYHDLGGDSLKKKERITMVIVGDKDSGKSTFAGHMMVKCNMIPEELVDMTRQEARSIKGDPNTYAWLMDESRVERASGATINASMKVLKTRSKEIALFDAPGSKTHMKNVISALAMADYIILTVSAIEKELV
jgi:hypothetical protein